MRIVIGHWGIAGAFVLLSGLPARAQHADDLVVGRSQSGQLKVVGFVEDQEYAELSPASGILQGWTGIEPGLDHLPVAVPGEDVYPLEQGATIWLRLVTADPAVRAIDTSFAIIDEPGEESLLGDHLLHAHLTWHVSSLHPAFDPEQCVWRAAFVLRDAGTTNYATSEQFVLSFSIVPLRPADGDFEEDQDVDLEDHAALVDCRHGPDTVPAPMAATNCEVDCINAFDFDSDGDVDLRDVAEFQIAFSAR